MMNSVVLAASERLRVVFDHRGDRWGHRIEMLSSGEPIQTLASMEGTPDDDWPPSPAFQTLELQSRSTGKQTALLVGKAGSSHWSMAVEADGATEAITFDIACRLSSVPQFLGSRYLSIAALAKSGLPRIEIVETDDEADRVLDVNKQSWSVLVSVVPKPGTWPRTVRWKYFVSIPDAC
jgi:hypothetical protein